MCNMGLDAKWDELHFSQGLQYKISYKSICPEFWLLHMYRQNKINKSSYSVANHVSKVQTQTLDSSYKWQYANYVVSCC
jgi:hypothetical protein